MKEITDEQIHDAADHYVLTENDHKWSNNDNTAGDNFGSFKAGAKWMREQVPKWIPVNEKLPEENQDVLVTDGESVRSAWFGKRTKSDNLWFRFTLLTVTHWQPLPEPPTS